MVEKLKMVLHSMTCGTRQRRLHARQVLIKMSEWLYFGHSNSNDMDLRYDTVDEGNLIEAIDTVGLFCKIVTIAQKKLSK